VHGMEAQYLHTERSQNFRMSELEATWLRLGLAVLEEDNQRRRDITDRYRAAAPLRWQSGHPRHVHHLAVFRTAQRSQVRAVLQGHGVTTAVHYPLSLTQQPAYRDFTRAPCPESESWAASCVTVPCFPELTDDEVERVVGALEAAFASHG
jgi:dTDP-3-amino-2,3,6-trideoxy-4-keto-D-glucose/dTDP-3-amino-3,4,6-trideoxy-alpha-D-glucose/dTDP-2,6-dideoxy-D-kanosamine transaminase